MVSIIDGDIPLLNVHITPQHDRVVEKTPNIQLMIRCIIHKKIQDRIPK